MESCYAPKWPCECSQCDRAYRKPRFWRERTEPKDLDVRKHALTLAEAQGVICDQLAKEETDWDLVEEATARVVELEAQTPIKIEQLPARRSRALNVLLSVVACMGLAGMIAFVLLPPGTINASMVPVFAAMIGVRALLNPQVALCALVIGAMSFGVIHMIRATNTQAQAVRTQQRTVQIRLNELHHSIEARQAILLSELQAQVKGSR
jgi:hypothetical protein